MVPCSSEADSWKLPNYKDSPLWSDIYIFIDRIFAIVYGASNLINNLPRKWKRSYIHLLLYSLLTVAKTGFFASIERILPTL